MSKDTINPKRWILDEQQKDAYEEWIIKRDNFHAGYCGRDNFKELEADWLRLNPCPLPNPVEIPSDEQINKEFEKVIYGCASDSEKDKIARFFSIKSAKWLRDLIFNKQ